MSQARRLLVTLSCGHQFEREDPPHDGAWPCLTLQYIAGLT